MIVVMAWCLVPAFAALALRAHAAPADRGARAPVIVALLARLPLPPGPRTALARGGDAALIARAGLDGVVAGDDLAAARAGGVAVAAATAVATIALAPSLLPVPILLALAAAATPSYVLARRGRRRAAVLRSELPDLLDLLGICVAAGMALDPALALATRRLGGVVEEEFGRLLRDLALGAPRALAYRALRERCDGPEVARTIAALLQAEELGSPLSRALRGQAGLLRAQRRQEARDRAARAAPKIQLVVALVMVPAVLMLVLVALMGELARQVGGVVGG